ncbi:MAG TPA: hypothetical protein PLH83_11700 [Ruminococcus sp.]|nr:hypothetical protein [Ruminococcus sp.]
MNENVNEQALENTQSEDNDGKAERTFTQEEVNKIVSDRLAKERSKNEATKNSADEKRAAELTERENKLTCKEYLLDKDYPLELLERLDTKDPEEFKKSADSIYNAICNKARHSKATPKFVQSDSSGNGIIEEAFDSSHKHKPRKYPGLKY